MARLTSRATALMVLSMMATILPAQGVASGTPDVSIRPLRLAPNLPSRAHRPRPAAGQPTARASPSCSHRRIPGSCRHCSPRSATRRRRRSGTISRPVQFAQEFGPGSQQIDAVTALVARSPASSTRTSTGSRSRCARARAQPRTRSASRWSATARPITTRRSSPAKHRSYPAALSAGISRDRRPDRFRRRRAQARQHPARRAALRGARDPARRRADPVLGGDERGRRQLLHAGPGGLALRRRAAPDQRPERQREEDRARRARGAHCGRHDRLSRRASACTTP